LKRQTPAQESWVPLASWRPLWRLWRRRSRDRARGIRCRTFEQLLRLVVSSASLKDDSLLKQRLPGHPPSERSSSMNPMLGSGPAGVDASTFQSVVLKDGVTLVAQVAGS
jgi:hypothetical protein